MNGKTVTVRRHNAAGPEAAAAAQKKRHAFERRVLTERQQAEATYTTTRAPRTPGERRARKKNGWTRAKSHARKARRLWRRHKTRAAAHGLLALGWAGGHAARRGAARARTAYRNWRTRRSRR